MFAPERVSVPVPVLVRASVPAVFLITPEKVLVALLSPTVNVGVPLTPSTVPLPEIPLMVSLKPAILNVPELMMRLPLPAPLEIWSALPSVRVALALLIVVLPA